MIVQNEESVIREVAIRMYTGEPCRICGVLLTYNDILDGAVFAGYSKNDESRAAHKSCWDKGLPEEEWAFK